VAVPVAGRLPKGVGRRSRCADDQHSHHPCRRHKTCVYERDPVFLEKLVLRLLTAMGYGGRAGAAEHFGRSGDQGLDGIVRHDPLGLDRVCAQTKRYGPEHAVGRPEIQGFVGALHGAQADRGVFIATSRFTADASGGCGRAVASCWIVC
jgi:restriction system protein